jgi:hypothetical protein
MVQKRYSERHFPLRKTFRKSPVSGVYFPSGKALLFSDDQGSLYASVRGADDRVTGDQNDPQR